MIPSAHNLKLKSKYNYTMEDYTIDFNITKESQIRNLKKILCEVKVQKYSSGDYFIYNNLFILDKDNNLRLR